MQRIVDYEVLQDGNYTKQSVCANISTSLMLLGCSILVILYRKISEKSIERVIVICEICRRNLCDPRCPNAPEPPAIYECTLCREAIREGDYFYKIDDLPYCEECIVESREEAESHWS